MDDTSEWPSQPVIAFTLHHVNKDCHMSANSTIYTVKVHPDAERVPIKAGVNRWTELRNHCSSDSILTTLLEMLYFPLVSAAAHSRQNLAHYGVIKLSQPDNLIAIQILNDFLK